MRRIYYGYAGASRAADRAIRGIAGKQYGVAGRGPHRTPTGIIARMTTSIIGGALIGIAAGLLFLVEGRIAGVSGIVTRGLTTGRAWPLAFVAAVVAGAAVVEAISPGSLPRSYAGSTPRLVLAGLLVGVGARLANGCTSGHGLCGVARGSARSIAAVATFTALGMITVLAVGALR
jgi:uncharacterized membrane protein YedE/YeeE